MGHCQSASAPFSRHSCDALTAVRELTDRRLCPDGRRHDHFGFFLITTPLVESTYHSPPAELIAWPVACPGWVSGR